MNTENEQPKSATAAEVESSAMLADLSIWTTDEDGGELKVKNALEVMTDDWIESGQACHQTIIDMRDALKKLIYG